MPAPKEHGDVSQDLLSFLVDGAGELQVDLPLLPEGSEGSDSRSGTHQDARQVPLLWEAEQGCSGFGRMGERKINDRGSTTKMGGRVEG